jgi:hypothetical protein
MSGQYLDARISISQPTGRRAGVEWGMFVVALKRGDLTMYLLSALPLRGTDRERAMRFHTAGDARRYAANIKVAETWTVEPA